MDDVQRVAVVDTGQYLLHEDGCVSLGKLASSDDFVEQFSSFADPKI